MTQPENRWTEISVEADQDAVDDLVNLLNRHCAGGAVVEEPAPPLYGSGGAIFDERTYADYAPARGAGGALFDERDQAAAPARGAGGALFDERTCSDYAPARAIVKGFLPVWEDETLRKLEIVLLLLSRGGHISEPRIRVLEYEDWAESWKAFFPPQPIGQRLVIAPTWVDYAPQAHEVVLLLDPGMAFGTGLHASTRLCLLALERLLAPGQRPLASRQRMLDVGTGSGILAIAAALQGAGEVHAIDNDPIAVEVARQNAVLNRVETLVTTQHATLPGLPPSDTPLFTDGGYDLLLINILAEIICAVAAGVVAALRPGGRFVASGIITERAASVVAALEAHGLVVDERPTEGEWVALVGHRPLGLQRP
jgi:ribosomal protein L11 methyltransferase